MSPAGTAELVNVRKAPAGGHPDSLYVLTPTRGAPKPAWVRCMTELRRVWLLKREDSSGPREDGPQWAEAQPQGGEYADAWNLGLAMFLATGWDKCLIVDDDETFGPEVVMDLVAFANGEGKGGVVAWVPYHTKEGDGVPVVNGLDGERLDVMNLKEPTRSVWFPGGFVLFTRAALERFIARGMGREYLDASGRWLYDFATSDFVFCGPKGEPRRHGDPDGLWHKRGPDLHCAHLMHEAGVPIWMLPIFSVGHYGESELKLPQAPPPPLSDRSVATVKGDWAKPGEEDRSVEGLSAIYTAEFFEMFADQAPEYAEVANALIAWWGAWAADSEVQKVKAAKLRPMHVYDVGCGPGQLIAALHARGVEARGMDGSRHAIEAADASVVPWIELGDLLEDPSRIVAGSLAGRERDATVTLVTCFEVAEHVPEKSAGLLVQRLCERAGPWPIVMTAATPGQGGHDHVNEQPKAYWRALFRRHGREEDEAASRFFAEAWKGFTRMPWMPRNVMVFR